MVQYKHLSLDERKPMEELLSENVSLEKIAKSVHRSRSTISRMIVENKHIRDARRVSGSALILKEKIVQSLS